MRPMRSPVLYVQTIGRGLRPHGNKTECLVLDYGNVVQNCGPLHDPHIPRKGERRASGAIDIKMKFCKECLEYCELQAKRCPSCDAIFRSGELTRESLKNLTVKSAHGSLLGNMDYNLRAIIVDRYVSKKGNECVRVRYHNEDYLTDSVAEYFLVGKFWARNNFYKRMKQLGINLEYEEVTEIPSKYETRATIEIYKESGYWKVK
jgi:hypothetical protein